MIELSVLEYVVLILAVYRLTRILIIDVIFEPVRERVWKKFPPSTKFGYLFTCPWCMSIWAALFLVLMFLIAPAFTYVVSLVLSISAAVGFIASRLDQ